MLLYNGQTSNGNGDFVSLNLVGGHLQFRYDLGSGMANITSGPGLVETDKWHRVKITRNGPHGTLQVMFSIIRIKEQIGMFLCDICRSMRAQFIPGVRLLLSQS